jgi:hypothetical protein
MVNNNKILTVSYGTFSCTLEGFDDSFGTMKAIAEYFRDLASDDRYFGAEPPQLDAEMLARIAQRQISSPVAAYQGESGIVLRAGEAKAINEVTAPAADVAKPTETPTEVVQPVAENGVADTVEDAVIEPEIAEPAAKTANIAAPDMPVADAIAEVVGSEPEIIAQDAAPMQAYVEPEIIPKDDIVPAADSIAAKLQRIRAVVSRNEATAKGVVFSDDEQDDTFLAASATVQDSFQARDFEGGDFEDEDLIATDETTAEAIEDADVKDSKADDGALDLSKSMLEIAAQDDEVQTQDTTQDNVAETDDPEVDDEIAKAFAAFEAVETADTTDTESADRTMDDPAAGNDDNDLFGDEADNNRAVDQEDDDLANLLADVRNTKTPAAANAHVVKAHNVRARVVKVKRSDFEAAIAAGQIEAAEDDDDSDVTTLSDEDEAELLRELADVEATAEADTDPTLDANANDDSDDDAAFDEGYDQDAIADAIEEANAVDPLASDFAYEEEEAPAKSNLPSVAVSDEADLSRLMDAADTKMDEPETSSRLEAYSHLRAAVAVANAEHAAGGTVGDHTDDGVYREDLASVVRPRRPESAANATSTERPNRPAEGKPAPLKLVAEQRVNDQTEQAPRGPVRPRRVSAVQVTETLQAGENKVGFTQFAQEMDATDLPDLLEAAAAYMSFVEGRAQFSRPQLMTKVRQIETSNFNREDGLRSFGKLLREGKIQKAGGGRFTASQDIGFRPDERAAG